MNCCSIGADALVVSKLMQHTYSRWSVLCSMRHTLNCSGYGTAEVANAICNQKPTKIQMYIAKQCGKKA